MNRKEIYEQEKKIMFDKMDKSYKGWRSDKKVVKRVKSAARQSAENLCNALEISRIAKIPAKEVMRQALMLTQAIEGGIDVAFRMIRNKLNQTGLWVEVLNFVLSKTLNVHESELEEYFIRLSKERMT
jgi:hypothetical protein